MHCPKIAMSLTIIGMVVFIAQCICGENVLKSGYGIIMLTFIIICLFYTHYIFSIANYGRRLFLWNWEVPKMYLTEAKQIKELLFVHSPARLQQQGTKHFAGHRLLMNMGLDCPQRRRTLEPLFYQSNIMEWVDYMVECTNFTLQLLKDKVDQSAGNVQIEISQYVNLLTAHIMSRTEFSSSYEQGIQIAQLLNQIHQMRAQSTWRRFIPISKYNKELKALEVKVEELLMEMIQQRVAYVAIARTNSHGNDIVLGKLLNVMHKKSGFVNMKLIVDECKTSLFAGHEAITLLITWTLMLLACNPYWQDLVRDEVNHICHGYPPTARDLPKFELLNMVIKESLRLYPPVPIIERRGCEDIRLSDGLVIPKGVTAWIPLLAINYSEEIWGRDANEFNPQRFASDSFAEARRHFLPFSAGPQHCPAQYYALMEAKIVLAMFISKFTFTISQNYRHAPVAVTTLKPKYGVQIHFKTLPE